MKTVQLYAKESNWPTVTPCTKINSKWSKDKTINILEGNIGSMLFDINLRFFFFGYISLGKGNKSKNKQIGLHQSKDLFAQ